MARPRKERRVCMNFGERLFVSETEAPCMRIAADELEALRLTDLEELDQSEAAGRMRISRGTLQRLLREARRKLTFALLEGGSIMTEGISKNCAPGCDEERRCRFCRRRTNQALHWRGEKTMKIAVATENGMVFQHFGHTPEFAVYDVEDGRIKSKTVEPTDGCGHGALAGFLQARGIDVLICGGIGGGAQMALAEANILLAAGVQGDADRAVSEFIAGTLSSVSASTCGGHEHGEGHSCGGHGHGEGHSCGGHGHGGGHSCGGH